MDVRVCRYWAYSYGHGGTGLQIWDVICTGWNVAQTIGYSANYVSLLKRWGLVGLPLSAQLVCSVCVCALSLSVCPIHFGRSNTRRWSNARLMLAHRLRRYPNISPVLGYRVVFGAMLNVGQSKRRRANINPALVQSIVLVPPAWSTDYG